MCDRGFILQEKCVRMLLAMGKIILFTTFILIGIFVVLSASGSINKSKSLQDVISTLPPTPLPATPTLPATQTNQPVVNQNVPKGSIPPPTPTPRQITATTEAVLKTTKGNITLSFYPNETPNTELNFLNRAINGFYNNLTFHRVEDWVVQGGDPLGNGTGGNSTMPVEFTNRPFVVGSVGSASRGDGKTQNDAQFFITKKESPWLNTKYTNFGMVKAGMDVVQKLEIGDKILGIIVN